MKRVVEKPKCHGSRLSQAKKRFLSAQKSLGLNEWQVCLAWLPGSAVPGYWIVTAACCGVRHYLLAWQGP